MSEIKRNYTPLAVILPESGQKGTEMMSLEHDETNELAFVKKKKEYNHFIHLCKSGKVATAVITAKALGVNRNTIVAWFGTPKAKRALQESSARYVEKIEESKDWKAHQWLLQQQTQSEDKKEGSGGVTNQILLINKDGQFRIGDQQVKG